MEGGGGGEGEEGRGRRGGREKRGRVEKGGNLLFALCTYLERERERGGREPRRLCFSSTSHQCCQMQWQQQCSVARKVPWGREEEPAFSMHIVLKETAQTFPPPANGKKERRKWSLHAMRKFGVRGGERRKIFCSLLHILV